MFDFESGFDGDVAEIDKQALAAVQGADILPRAFGLKYFVHKFSHLPDKTREIIAYSSAAAELFSQLEMPEEQFSMLWSEADAYNENEETEACLLTCRKALKLGEENWNNQQRAVMLNNIAIALVTLKKYKEAIDEASLCAAIQAEDGNWLGKAKAHITASRAHVFLKNLDLALSEIDACIESLIRGGEDSMLAEAYGRKAHILIAKKNWESAEEYQKIALAHLDLLPDSDFQNALLWNSARINVAKSRFAVALDEIEKVIAAKQSQKSLERVVLCTIEKAKCYLGLERKDQALAEVVRAKLVSRGRNFDVDFQEIDEAIERTQNSGTKEAGLDEAL
jgi:hypothetical protein